jgi:hypothetical protein
MLDTLCAMATPKRLPTNIRLWSETIKRLEPLAEAEVNVSELANEILLENLTPATVREHLDRKIKSLRKALAAV